MSAHRRIEIREILVHLGVDGSDELIEDLRRQGLFESDELSPVEAEELRVATLLIRELDVNPEGVQVALHLRRRLLALESRAAVMLERLREIED